MSEYIKVPDYYKYRRREMPVFGAGLAPIDDS